MIKLYNAVNQSKKRIVRTDTYVCTGMNFSSSLSDYDISGNDRCTVCLLHAKVPSILSQITAILSEEGINIENLTNKSKGNNAYTVVDVSGEPKTESIAKLEAIADVVRVRVIKQSKSRCPESEPSLLR